MTVGEITQKSGNNLLSVIVPVYNVTTCLDRCVNSIIDQSFQNFELILVNDGSTDGSGDKCEEWKKKDNRIQVVHQTNSGVSAARNHGLSHANGDSVIFLDADDYIERDMFSGMVSRLYSDKADIVCCGYYDDWSLIGGGCQRISPKREIVTPNTQIPRFLDASIALPVVWNKLFKRDALIDTRGNYIRFPEGICIGEDFVWMIDVLSSPVCQRMSFISEPYYHYMHREESALNDSGYRIDDKALTEIEAFRIIRSKCREISDECFYLACRRSMGLLMMKLKIADNQNNSLISSLVSNYLLELVNEYPIKTKHDFLIVSKVKVILMLKKLHMPRAAVMYVENKLGSGENHM